MVPPDESVYYCNYPIAHLLACASNQIGNISIKQSMFIIGAMLALSTIFVYLIVKKITSNINIALLAFWMLTNFSFTKKAFTKGKKKKEETSNAVFR